MEYIQEESEGTISLDEYIAILDTEVNFESRDSILESRVYLKRLANNKNFIYSQLIKSLSQVANKRDPYSEQTITLYFDPKRRYTIRINFWLPANNINTENTVILSGEYFAYGYPHDHNFDLLTVGALGSGYRTIVYQYNKDDLIGYDQEYVPLKFFGDFHLSDGDVIFYDKSKDIHVVFPPSEISASLNLLIHKDQDRDLTQYNFDLNTHRAKEEKVPSVARPMVLNLAEYTSDKGVRYLKNIIENYKNARTRASAMLCLLKKSPNEKLYVQEQIRKRKNLYARKVLSITRNE